MTKCGGAGFGAIADDVKEVADKVGCSESSTPLAPKSFLPKRTNSFYMYEGSLTTPPCAEKVKFIVFCQPGRIDKRQVYITYLISVFLAVLTLHNIQGEP